MKEKDNSLNGDLEQIEKAYKRLDAPQPPDLVDRAVLNAARRELERARPPRRRLGWISAFASATVIVLAISVVLQQRQDATPVAPSREIQLNEPVPAAAPAPAPELKDEDQFTSPPAQELSGAERETDRQEGYRLRKSSAADLRQNRAPAEIGRASKRKADEESADPEGRVDEVRSTQRTENPEEWLDRIILLKRSELWEQFQLELAAFRRAYPDYPLPEELQE
jgi:hypothetical protein